jgi:hypothetical protein
LTPQAKLIEFLAGIMSGMEYLSDLNDGPRPLAQDATVARAWDQAHWAHYSSVSRTLAACDAQTVQAVQHAIEKFSRPFIREAVQEVLRTGLTLVFDLDLMGQPVSSTSTTYPLAAFGWMDDQVRLGYQLARICLSDKQGTRLWLQGFHHPGDTISATCLQELVRAAEVQTGVRPQRRTDLLRQRITAQQTEFTRPQRLLDQQQAKQRRLQQTQLCLHVHIAQAAQVVKKPISTAKKKRLQAQVQKWQRRLPRLAQQCPKGTYSACHLRARPRPTSRGPATTPGRRHGSPGVVDPAGNRQPHQSRSSHLSRAHGQRLWEWRQSGLAH